MSPHRIACCLLRLALPLLLLGCVAPFAPAQRPSSKDGATTIVFVRHAETTANATGVYRGDTVNQFTTKGVRQVQRLEQALAASDFDVVVVSPILRARNTIRPFLKSKNMTARIWPELAECCHQKRSASDLAKARTIRLKRSGTPIALNKIEKPHFGFSRKEDRLPYDVDGYAEGIALVMKLCDRIRSEFSGSGKQILIVGHSLSGSRMLEILTGSAPEGRIHVKNAAPTVLRETSRGRFEIESLNTLPQ